MLPLLVFLFWAFRTRHGRVIYFFLLALGLFLLITLIQIGWWVPEFLAQLRQYDNFPRQWVPANAMSLPGLIWLGGTAVLIFSGIQEYRKNPIEFPHILFGGAISLILLITPHTAEYDLPALLLPFVVYAPRFLQSKFGTGVWAFIMWTPWLSWALFQLLGLTTSYWYSRYWLHYPQVLVVVLLLFLPVVWRIPEDQRA